MTITNGYCTLAEFKDRLLQQRTYSASTLAFVLATKKITDTAKGLAQRFPHAIRLQVSGTASNNGIYTVVSIAAGEIVVNETLADESAGTAFTITDVSDTADDAAIEQVIEAVSREIDAYTGRSFYARTETRLFDVPAGRELLVDDDLISITTLTNGDSAAIANTEYKLYPLNSSPKFAIRLLLSSSVSWQADANGNVDGVISVLGSWGYASAAPKDIREACLIQSLRLYRRKDAPFGVAGTNAVGESVLIAGVDPDVKHLLAPYVRQF